MAREEIIAWMTENGVTVVSEFIPFSKSRNAQPRHGRKEPWKSLNWRVTIKRQNRDILTSEYSAGVGHCPSHKSPRTPGTKPWPELVDRMCDHEIEYGKTARYMVSVDKVFSMMEKPILPDPCDVLAGLAMDADVLDYNGFEDWADNYGYDADSRSAEAIYRECIDIALKLRNGLGDDLLKKLHEARQNY